MLLAAIFGVLVGLTIIHFTSRPIFPGIPGARVTAHNSAPSRFGLPGPSMVTNAFNSISRISVVPTLDRSMNILVMGVDSNGRNTQRFLNTRSDTMMLVHVDPSTKKVGVVSIPRDSRVKLPPPHGIDKINSAHALGGPQMAVETVKEYFAVPIDRYVVVDTFGLKKLFEALGPVEVLVEKRMRYRDRAAGLYVDLKPGLQVLDPKQAEEYVRFRHDPKGDIGRIDRQQWFVRQVAKKLREPAVLLKLPDIFKFANDYVVTDLTIDEMARLANFGKDIEPHQVETAMLPGRADFISGGSYWIPDVEASAVVFSRILGQPISVAERSESSNDYGSDAASAATTNESGVRRMTVLIKYPHGQEHLARQLETACNAQGYAVRYLIRSDVADCQHEQIVQNSYRANEVLTQQLREKFPCFNTWPVVVSVEPRSHIDFTLVISPNSHMDLGLPAEAQASDEDRHHRSDRI